MSVPPDQVALLKKFVETCKANPSILHEPNLDFFKKYLESLGAVLPPQKKCEGMPQDASEQCWAEESEEAVEVESDESDVEIDDKDVVIDEDREPPEYGDVNIDVTEEMIDIADKKREDARTAVSDGDVDSGIKLITEAIKNNPLSALLYAKRASYFLRVGKMNKAVHDCNKAIDLNPDSAQPYKWRGKANKLLGRWEDSYHDLTMACKLDYDNDANEMLQDVKPNAMKIMEHRRKYQRKYEEKEIKERRERVKKAKAQYESEKQRKESCDSFAFETGDFPTGGFADGPGAGGFPGGPGLSDQMSGMPDISSLLSDPDVLQAFQDPEIAAAFQDVSQNPSNITKYQNNPKIQAVINKMASKFGEGSEK